MPNDGFSDKERALISVAASVGSGCRPCTAYHIKSARAAGARERSIFVAIEAALAGRASASSAIGVWAERCQGVRPEVDPEFRASKRLIADLMSIATAVAVNSAPDLERHLAAARESGATVEQIRSAIGIARKIQRVAQEKIEAITDRLEEQVPSIARTPSTTGCCSPEQAAAPEATVGNTSGCGCK